MCTIIGFCYKELGMPILVPDAQIAKDIIYSIYFKIKQHKPVDMHLLRAGRMVLELDFVCVTPVKRSVHLMEAMVWRAAGCEMRIM
jgi:hypothetical protein